MFFFYKIQGQKASAEGQSPPQELEVGPRSGPYLLVTINSTTNSKSSSSSGSSSSSSSSSSGSNMTTWCDKQYVHLQVLPIKRESPELPLLPMEHPSPRLPTLLWSLH